MDDELRACRQHLGELHLARTDITDRSLSALGKCCPHLTVLNVDDTGVTPAGLHMLLGRHAKEIGQDGDESPHLQLRELYLSRCGMSALSVLRILANSPCVRNLEILSLMSSGTYAPGLSRGFAV